MSPFVSRVARHGRRRCRSCSGSSGSAAGGSSPRRSLAALVALHELYAMARSLGRSCSPATRARSRRSLGAQLGGVDWMLGGFLLTLLLAFLLYGIAETRQTAHGRRSASTVLGAAWIGLGLGHVLLLRDIPEHGPTAASPSSSPSSPTTRSRTSSAASSAGTSSRPRSHPGKTWEGFVGRHRRGDRASRSSPSTTAGLPHDSRVARARRRRSRSPARPATCSSRRSSATCR